MESSRRSVITRIFSAIAGVAGLSLVARSQTPSDSDQLFLSARASPDVKLYPGSIRYGNLVFVSGTGADAESEFEIKADTDFVLKKMEKRLIAAGSSMEKVLKVTVFLSDMADFEGMNSIYKGRFGKNPPVRSTVAVAKGGIPGKSIVEIDCIAYV
ncbi:RidA family protein [Daejeonella sp. H1SJ63]|uniref:RidA family protein n=1 Tax=Daejeonella sp. H1SJ63 TaxID=3034145 RepID=UPI0023EAF7AE|nr:RidA family protein [Daejeonella sp. H1SJ63]